MSVLMRPGARAPSYHPLLRHWFY